MQQQAKKWMKGDRSEVDAHIKMFDRKPTDSVQCGMFMEKINIRALFRRSIRSDKRSSRRCDHDHNFNDYMSWQQIISASYCPSR